MSTQLKKYQEVTANMTMQEILEWSLDTFSPEKLVVASSLSLEDQILTDACIKINKDTRIFTLDTGRLFQETYDVMQATIEKYGITYETYAPESDDIVSLIKDKGPNLFYKSILDRKECCYVRKVKPLKKVLKTANAWVTGLRKEQSLTRDDLNAVMWDESLGLYKINPLVSWSMDNVWSYIKDHNVPYNILHDKGFISIGCAPCTRAIKNGETIRNGRWWWEDPEHKECGLHR